MSFIEHVTVAHAPSKSQTKQQQQQKTFSLPINHCGHFANLCMLVSEFESSFNDIWKQEVEVSKKRPIAIKFHSLSQKKNKQNVVSIFVITELIIIDFHCL